MPALANITVKKNDNVTDIVYTGVQPSSGDTTPAVWRAPGGTAPAHAPELRLIARNAAKGVRRALRGTYQYPQISTNSTTGVTSVIDRASGDVNFTYPKAMAQVDINEAVSQFCNLMYAALIKQCLKDGFSAS